MSRGIVDVYSRMGDKEKEFITKEYESDVAQGFDGSIYDFIGERYVPEYGEKVTKKRTAATSAKGKEAAQTVEAARPPQDTQGNYDLSEYKTVERYGSTDKEGNLTTQSYASAATMPMVSIFQNKGYTLPLTTGTVDKLTGKEVGSEWAGGTIPIKIVLTPEAVKDINIDVTNPETGNEETVTIKAGERVPEYVQKRMEVETSMGEDYKYVYKPYVEANMYKSMMVDPTDGSLRPKVESEKITTLRPYGPFRNYLRNFAAGLNKDFSAFDKDIKAIEQQLNKDLASEYAQYQSTGI